MTSKRHFQFLIRLLVLVGIFCFLPGCQKTPADFLRTAQKAEAQAKRAYEQQQPQLAEEAALRAESALAGFKQWIGAKKLAANAELTSMVERIQICAESAREYAGLALEESQLRDKLATFKGRTYRRFRGTICDTLFGALAPTVEKAAQSGPAALSSIETELANKSWNFVQLISERTNLANGAPDWIGAAKDLRAWSTNPPPKAVQYLALGFSLSGFSDFALFELESIDHSRLSSTNARAFFHAQRGFLCAWHGWEHLATCELKQAVTLQPQGWERLSSTQSVALLHLWFAWNGVKKADWTKVDVQVSKAVQAWPDNPIAVFLTGEKLAANGEWVKAADSLEARAAGMKDEWLAKRLAQRARDLRDGKGTAKALFAEPGFFAELSAHVLVQSLKDSASANYLQSLLNDAKTFGSRLSDMLPGVTGKNGGKAESE